MTNIIRACVPALLSILLCATAEAATRTVCATGCNHTTIQAAINATPTGTGAAGTTILVHPGTYAGDLSLGTRSGTSVAPFIIKALYPARRPLDGAQWAQNASNRSIINGGTYGIHAVEPTTVTNILIDGFYFTGQSTAAIHFVNDSNLWIKNNVMEETGLGAGEDYGGIVILFGNVALIQNNLWLIDTAGTSSDANFISLDQYDSIIEYNECRLAANDDLRGRCWYIAHSSSRTIFRYNYTYINQQCGTSGLCMRFRDSSDYQIHNNFYHTTDQQEHFYLVEEVENISNESHDVYNNTWLLEAGIEDDFNAIGSSHIGGSSSRSTIHHNIFRSGINDTNSYAFGWAFTGSSGNVIDVTNNLYWNLAGASQPASTSGTVSGNSNTNVTISTTTGCATAGASNATHGANLDVSSIPYRKCDGSAYPIAGMFGLTPPSAPTNLRIIP